MGNRRKIDDNDPADAQSLASEVFSASLLAIRDEIRGLAAGTVKPGRHDKASRIAWLAGQATKIAAEERKAAAAADAATKRIGFDTLLTWARLQTREVRAKLVSAIAALDSTTRKSVLG